MSSNDALLAYRMAQMELDNKSLNDKVDKVQADVTDLKDSITNEFAALKKTLFERPLFVTYELLKVELEGRDRIISDLKVTITDLKDSLKASNSNTVSTARHYTTVGATILCVFLAPFVSDYLGRLS